MCGRYRLSAVERIEEQFEAEQTQELCPRYNIAPSQPVPIVRQQGPRRSVAVVRWGLVPFWAKDGSIGYKMINARSETVMQRPAFRNCFFTRRCLIPADGFYEWSKLQKEKRPFHLGMTDNSVFAFAGLWDSWRAPDGIPLESCTILTTTPNSLVADLHNRMPVILPRDQYEMWLSAPPSDAARLANVLKPFDSSLMKRYEVSSLINSPKNDSADCVVPVQSVRY
jgi:putative SOS response-associated peptidase YedK